MASVQRQYTSLVDPEIGGVDVSVFAMSAACRDNLLAICWTTSFLSMTKTPSLGKSQWANATTVRKTTIPTCGSRIRNTFWKQLNFHLLWIFPVLIGVPPVASEKAKPMSDRQTRRLLCLTDLSDVYFVCETRATSPVFATFFHICAMRTILVGLALVLGKNSMWQSIILE